MDRRRTYARAHDVPFMIEHRQKVCELTFEQMIAPPTKLYGSSIGSNYQGQMETPGQALPAAVACEEARPRRTAWTVWPG
ncbi:MAG TPA: 2'-deoxycytidine 5'-triphosphate deaminase [Acidimicrobiales bacterium]